ncbi:MAG: hypothetical protein FWH53_03060 [Leptospirales bacterium]|nr:hypothetical protein [Leptospirales bacterium]
MIFYLAILLILCGFLIVISALFIEISEAKKTEEDTPLKIKTAEDYRPLKTKSSDNFKSGSNRRINRPDDLEIISSDKLDNDELYNKGSIFSEFEDTFHDPSKPERVLKKYKFDTKSRFPDNIDQRIKKSHSIAAKSNLESDIEIKDNLKSIPPQKNPPLQEKKNSIVYAVMFDDRSDIIDYSSGVGIIDSTFLKYKDIKRIGKGVIESDSDGINFYLDERLYRFDSHRIYDIWCGENYIALPLKGHGLVKLFIIENSGDFPYKVESDFKQSVKGSHVL